MKAVPLAVLTVALSLWCDTPTDDSPAKPPQPTDAELRARADEVYAAFRHWHDNLPAAGATVEVCDDDEIARLGTEKNRVEFLAYQSLRRTLGEPWDGTDSMVRFMTDAKLRYPPRAELDFGEEQTVKQLMRMWGFVEYVGVIVPSHERKAEALGPYVGFGGALKGQLVIFRPREPDPLCHTPFELVSTGGTAYQHEVGANSADKQSKATHALKRKTCSDLKAVLTERIGALTKVLQPGLIDCNAV